MVKIACSHGGNNFWIYKDNWSMQEEIEFVVQVIQDQQINKWHFKGGKIWMQALWIHWSMVASNRYHNETCHHICQWQIFVSIWKQYWIVGKKNNFKATSQSTTKRNKKNFHEKTFGMFTNMVENYHGEEFWKNQCSIGKSWS